ncbi:MAG TPA: c-type cytochrome [Blastocatellia bacterium]|jgi:putative heme-binding domain-containing protein
MKTGLAQLNLRLVVSLVFAGLVAGASLTSRASAPDRAEQEDKLKDAQTIAEGAKLFAPNCSSGYCHGANGVGGGGPRLRGKGLDATYLFKTISNGIAGTGMPGFKSELSQQQIWKIVAFIMSGASSTPAAPETKPAPPVATVSTKSLDSQAAAPLIGNAQAGKAIFFDSAQQKSCRACHSFAGEGALIGPDLSKIGNKPAREIFLSIILPPEVKDPRYRTMTLTLKNGEKIVGIKKEEDDDTIRVYDIAELPAVLRTIQKPDVARAETGVESSMPRDYAATYTIKQILDLVTFLRSSDPQAKPVTINDIF